MPIAVWSSTSVMNTSSTELASSFETLPSVAIAVPSRCTSFGLMYFNTSAASASPSVRSRSAARSVPERCADSAFIGAHPFLDDLGDTRRVVAGDAARRRDLLVEARPGERRVALHEADRGAGGIARHDLRRRAGVAGQQAPEERPHDAEGDREHQ